MLHSQQAIRLSPTHLQELPTYFENLKVKKIKSNKRGNPVLGYEFTWKPETTGEWEEDKYKQNDFYKPKNSTSNVPDWVEKEYKHSATAEEQAKLEELRRSMLEDQWHFVLYNVLITRAPRVFKVYGCRNVGVIKNEPYFCFISKNIGN